MNLHQMLPPTWVWTQTRRTELGATLYFCRDTRWEPAVPDVVDVSRESAVVYAFECDEANSNA